MIKNIFKRINASDYSNCVALSPDGLLIATQTYCGSVGVWDINSKTLKCEILAHIGEIWNILFSCNGKYLLTHANYVRLWNLDNGEKIKDMDCCGSLSSMDFSPKHENLLAVANLSDIIIYNVDTVLECSICYKYSAKNDEIIKVEFTGDGEELVSLSDKQLVRIWDANNWQIKKIIQIDGRHYDFLLWPQTNEILFHNTEKIWTAKSIEFSKKLKQKSCQSKYIVSSPIENNCVATIEANSIAMWDANHCQRVKIIKFETSDPDRGEKQILFTLDGNSIVISDCNAIMVTLLDYEKMVLPSIALHRQNVTLYVVLNIINFIIASKDQNSFANESLFYNLTKVKFLTKLMCQNKRLFERSK